MQHTDSLLDTTVHQWVFVEDNIFCSQCIKPFVRIVESYIEPCSQVPHAYVLGKLPAKKKVAPARYPKKRAGRKASNKRASNPFKAVEKGGKVKKSSNKPKQRRKRT